ncbi:MAG: hypothetical protein NEA02_03075 [Thermoanaerobaculia bacterium]|nr:hypothetical protein [Thermoanaerobaculia bacterium]
MLKTRGTGLVTALAACCFFPRLVGQTPVPARVSAGLVAATPLADLALASAQRAREGPCLRGRGCAVDVTAKNSSDVASPAVSVATVGGASEDDFDRMGVSVPPRASRMLRVNVFIPRDHPADTLERTFELRFPNGRPYDDRTSAGNRITARLPIDVVDAQVFGVGGIPRRPVAAGAALPLTVRLKNDGTVRLDMRFREEGSGREIESPTVRLEPGEVKPVPWTLVVPERSPVRFTPALVLSWVEVATPSGPLGGARFSGFESPRGNRFDLAIDVAPLPAFDLDVADIRIGAPIRHLTDARPGGVATFRLTGFEMTTVLRNRGTETWGSSFMIGVILSAGRPETSLHAVYRMDFAAAGPIAVGATRDYATRIALDPDRPLLSRIATPERGLSPGQWYTLDISVVSSDDRNAANNRGRWVVLFGGDGRVSEMRRLP